MDRFQCEETIASEAEKGTYRCILKNLHKGDHNFGTYGKPTLKNLRDRLLDWLQDVFDVGCQCANCKALLKQVLLVDDRKPTALEVEYAHRLEEKHTPVASPLSESGATAKCKKCDELAYLLIECRDALPAISLSSARLRGISLSLANRIEEALKPWEVSDGGI